MELRLDTRFAPRGVGTPHIADQLPDLGIDSRPAAPASALSAPVGPESLPVPLHDRGRVDENEGSLPAWQNTAQPDPEEPVTVPEPHPSGLPTEHHQLLPKCHVLEREIPSALERGNDTPPYDATQSPIDACSR